MDTRQQAIAELARRELSRRQQPGVGNAAPQDEGFRFDYKKALSPLKDPGNIISGMAPQMVANEFYQQTKEPILKKIENPLTRLAVGTGIDILSAEGAARTPGIAGSALKAASKVPSWLGGRAINFRIKPNRYQYAYGRDPGAAVAEEIGPQMTMGGLDKAIGKRVGEIGSDVNARLSARTDSVDVTPAFENYSKKILSLGRSTRANKGVVDSLRDQGLDFFEVAARDYGMQYKNGRFTIPSNKVLDFKRFVADQGAFKSLDPATKSVGGAVNKFHADLNKGIRAIDPKASELSHRQSELIAAKAAVKNRGAIEQNHWPVTFQEIGMSGLGMAAGGPAGAAGSYLASKALRSVPGSTTIGSALGRTGKGMRSTGEALKQIPVISPIQMIFDRLKRRTALNPVTP